MLESMSFISFAYFRQLAVAFLKREQFLKSWDQLLCACSVPQSYDPELVELLPMLPMLPITRFDRLLAAQSTVPTERMYHIWAEVTDWSMPFYGRLWCLTAGWEPLTHREACTVLSKHTQYSWRRMWLVEIGSLEEQRLAAKASECVPFSTGAQGGRGRP